MKKILGWILGKSKIGKGIDKTRGLLDGYKAYIAGAAMLIPGALNLILDFQSQKGFPDLGSLSTNPNYRMMLEGWAIIATRAAIAKTQRVAEVAAGEATVAAEGK